MLLSKAEWLKASISNVREIIKENIIWIMTSKQNENQLIEINN